VTARPCLDCGEVTDNGTRCVPCAAVEQARVDRKRGTSDARGYGHAWRSLSVRARRAQPWCVDCFTREDLTVDHLPGAWEKRARGERLTLLDVEVVCRACNSRRGARRSRGAT
jgi:5-methylcytosine-specific restriction protein A